ncbi:MAG: hypothetical protein FD189_2479 [Elusimicrobia bacterium]|nr:MAG: hypothetical protein FD154_2437 [Elusimicrobiota bacterium]KAF0152373.1 MAG: hypothetical protein FD189_2479 [Elusimicrobiota bacterium]
MKYSYQVVLPAGMRAALKEYSPAFRIFGIEDYDEEFKKSVPLTFSSTACYSAVFTDLNGDGRADAVLFGEADLWVEGLTGEGKWEHFPGLAVLSEGTTRYQIVPVLQAVANRPVRMSLKMLSAGKGVAVWNGKEILLKDNDIGLFLGRTEVSVYRWDTEESKFAYIDTVKQDTIK